MANVVDLDVLRPEPQPRKLLGEEFDIAFIPANVAIEVEAILKRSMLDMLEHGGDLDTDSDEYRAFAQDLILKQLQAVELIWREQGANLTAERVMHEASTQQVQRLLADVKTHLYGPITAQMQEVIANLSDEEKKSAAKASRPEKTKADTGPTTSSPSPPSTDGVPPNAVI